MTHPTLADRWFRTHLLLGAGGAKRLWHWDHWSALTPQLDRLLEGTRGRPQVRSSQIERARREHLRFGRLGIDDASHAKWTHGSPVTDHAGLTWHFEFTTIYAPSRAACVREGWAPDVYFELSSVDSAQHFDQVVLLAVAEELPGAVGAVADELVWTAAREMGCVLGAVASRRFEYPAGASFVRSMDYLTHEELGPLRQSSDAPTLEALHVASVAHAARSRGPGLSEREHWRPLEPGPGQPSLEALLAAYARDESRRFASERVAAIVLARDLGAQLEWVEYQGRPALRVLSHDGAKRMSFLTDAERAELEAALARS